jgi:hypothetical protein
LLSSKFTAPHPHHNRRPLLHLDRPSMTNKAGPTRTGDVPHQLNEGSAKKKKLMHIVQSEFAVLNLKVVQLDFTALLYWVVRCEILCTALPKKCALFLCLLLTQCCSALASIAALFSMQYALMTPSLAYSSPLLATAW